MQHGVPHQLSHQRETVQTAQEPHRTEASSAFVGMNIQGGGGEQQQNGSQDGNEAADDIGEDPLLEMQKNLSTFEDSVRSFVGAGSEKALFAEYQENPAPRPRPIVRRGPRKPAEPTGDVKLRLASASNAFMGGRLDEALDYVNDAIRINGEIHRAWSLLAEILRERKEYKQSLLALVCAAHLQPKVFDSWMQCALFALQLLEELPEDADDTSKIAIMVLSQAIMIEPNNLGVRQTRAALYLTRESYKLSIKDYMFIVEHTPYDVVALQGLVDASVQFSESSKKASEGQREAARDAYSRCIAHFRTEYPTGGANPGLSFTWEDAFTYVALLTHLEQYEDALREARSLARWLLGRLEEKFWDEIKDDREWDESEERRRDVPGYNSEKYPASSYGSGLPLRLRISLAICRLRLDQNSDDEAMVRIRVAVMHWAHVITDTY
jgi:general transcription factor 3C polypeptide 3 (transcription factor C subunit 4)